MGARLGDGLRQAPDGAARLEEWTAATLVEGEILWFGTVWPALDWGKGVVEPRILAITNARTLVMTDAGDLGYAFLHSDGDQARFDDPQAVYLPEVGGLLLPLVRLSPGDREALRISLEHAASSDFDAELDGRVREHLEQARWTNDSLHAGGSLPRDMERLVNRWRKGEARAAKKADRQAAAAEREREQAEAAERAGAETFSGIFGNRKVVIYANGYVRVGALMGLVAGPYEPLLDVEVSADVQKKTGVGRAAGAVVTLGVNLAGSNKRGDVWVTISTPGRTHVLHEDPPTAMNLRTAKQIEAAGRAVAGRALLGQPVDHQPVADEPQAPRSEPGDDIAARLRRLDGLRDQGLLTDQEHAERRARILDDL